MEIEIERPDLTQYQKDILYCNARFTITEASTKVGKTYSHIYWIFERAHEEWNKLNYNHWWVAPVYSQAKIAFKRMEAIVVGTGIYKINQSNLIITTPIGTHIHFKSADKPDNLFGEDVYSCVFDEAPRARKEAFYALRSTLTATNAPMKLIGNFGGVSNWMHQLKEKSLKDPLYKYFKITAWDAVEAGILEREEIEQAQRDLPLKVFKQLYLAEEQESEDMLCTYDNIRDMWTNSHVLGGNKYISADIALHGSDNFILIVWDGFIIIDIIAVDKCDANEVTELIKSTAEKYKVGQSNIVYDADGLGSFLRGYLKNAKPFNNGAKATGKINYKNLKSQCGYEFAKIVNNKGIFIKSDFEKEDIIKEMECLQSFGLDSDGKIQLMPKAKIKEFIGHSPDILDALIMRMYFEVQPKISRPRARNIN